MNSYICPNCNREFNRKAHLGKHLNKKSQCVQINIIPDIKNTEIQKNPKKSKKIQQNPLDIKNVLLDTIRNNPFIDFNQEFKPKIEADICNVSNLGLDLTCQYCMNTFSQTSNLNKHLKFNCKVKKQQDNEKEEIFKQLLLKDNIIKEKDEQINKILEQNQKLIYQIEKLKKTTKMTTKSVQIAKNITNNTNNLTNTSNIVLFNFGKEDLSVIDKKQYINRVLKNNISGVKIPEEILKLIHFNPQYPQLSNIYISDINREKCMVYDDGMWKLSPTDKIPEVIDKVVTFSYNQDEELREIFKNNKPAIDRLNIINKYIKMNDNDYIQELQEELENELVDNNNIKRCEDFRKKTYDTLKTTLYNEGKKIKK